MSDEPIKAKRITLLDVAHHAGVSRATASLVVRNSPLVSDTTRETVEAAMAELGYVYNLGAARMRAARSRTVGVIVPNLSNPFFAVMIAGIESVLETAGYAVILANSHESAEKETGFLRRMREHGVDGLVLCPSEATAPSIISDAAKWGLPLVQALRMVPNTKSDYAGIDYRGGMRQATAYLIDAGHRRIGFISGNRHHSAQADRLAGFNDALAGVAGCASFVMEVALTHQAARAAAKDIVARSPPPTALIGFNDVVGLGLHRGLSDLGLSIGEDIALIGFDNVAEAELVRPALASVSTEPHRVGAHAAELLLRRLDEPEADHAHRIEPAVFVERESCQSVKSDA
ncbi:LacI family DNA-binding transcriptional regulator [Pararhizobium haloflavum]|uniref:LacI family DNA-binding transcriptional regulator n=1 Tax=Pararhizobium haloflavum TaxID=2037914 RepID=UPI001FDF0534|nr:LacI family DNA-binding transcriptional regulator [Pararhizobium haloflavum]